MQIHAENREKVKIIVVASCVVFAILMIVALIVSLVGLASANQRKSRLERQLREINAQIERNSSDIAYYQSSDYIEMMAREYLNMKGEGEIVFIGKK